MPDLINLPGFKFPSFAQYMKFAMPGS